MRRPVPSRQSGNGGQRFHFLPASSPRPPTAGDHCCRVCCRECGRMRLALVLLRQGLSARAVLPLRLALLISCSS